MALTDKEKELLAVVRYYNENKKLVAKLVTKLMKDFNLADVKVLTNLNGDEIMKLQEMTFRKPGPSKATKKVQASIREASAELDPEMGDTLVEIEGETYVMDHKLSDVITLDADSPLHERIAYEMSMQIGAKFKSGDAFYSTKTAMEEFGASQERVRAALKLLKEKNLIEYRDGIAKKGYVVV